MIENEIFHLFDCNNKSNVFLLPQALDKLSSLFLFCKKKMECLALMTSRPVLRSPQMLLILLAIDNFHNNPGCSILADLLERVLAPTLLEGGSPTGERR